MFHPGENDYIDIHNHGSKPLDGVFIVECLMAHESHLPACLPGMAYTYGIHPWFLNEANRVKQTELVRQMIKLPEIVALGEAGFDKLRGPSMDLQREVFEQQAILAEEIKKPLIIHCVRAWDEVLASFKKIRPRMPWMIHGFRGNIKLAGQLLAKGIYLSIWFDFALRKESSELLRNLPVESIFLETDGSGVDIREIYSKVANDKRTSVDELKSIMHHNFKTFFHHRQ